LTNVRSDSRTRLMELYALNLPTVDIVKALGLTYPSVTRMMNRMGLEHRDKVRGFPVRVNEAKQATRDRLTALWREGLTQAEIGKRMGVSTSAVSGMVSRLGLRGTRAEPQRRGVGAAGPLGGEAGPLESGARGPLEEERGHRAAGALESAPKRTRKRSRAPASRGSAAAPPVKANDARRLDQHDGGKRHPPGDRSPHVESLKPPVIRLDARILAFMELRTANCRWPLLCDGDCDIDGRIYCGAEAENGSYCVVHQRLGTGMRRER
jgi:hypothetical protein